ncbi:MAG: TonB-dependent receptor [Tannerellaceae bacterium]|jgi:hypothetical protein|nr:TonB-dependent receptor [Tannerellaceae bacterium]
MTAQQLPFFRLLLLLLAASLAAPPLAGQTGTLKGQVTDADSREPLIGAMVVLSETNSGAVTDEEGYFLIEGLRPGAYSLSASYLSYRSEQRLGVEVKAGLETLLDLALAEAGMQLQGIAVVAQRKLSSETALLGRVRQSLPVAGGISSQQIEKTQDSDAAQAMRRVPGVTLSEDRFVVVRGLAQRYNNVWLNDAATPSGETDNRSFSFDVLPSSLIDHILIFKSPTAELPADFSGGFVRMATRNVPEGNTFSVSVQGGYNTSATFRDFELAQGYGADLLASGAPQRELPRDLPPHLGSVTPAEAAEITQRINQGWRTKSFSALPEGKLSLALNRSFPLGQARLGQVAALNYSNGYDYFETDNNNYLSYDSPNDQSSYRFRYRDLQYRNTVKLGALLNLSLLMPGGKWEVRNFFNRRGVSSLSRREGVDYYSDENIRRWESIYTSRTTYSGQLSGQRDFPGNGTPKLDWTAGYAWANTSEPDRKDVKSMLHTGNGQSRYYVSDPSRYYQDLDDHSLSLASNYEHSLRPFPALGPILLRGGIYGEYRERDFAARRFVYNLLGSGYNRYAEWDYTVVFAPENMAADKIYLRESTNKSDAYDANRTLGAAYLSAQLPQGKHLEADLGLRMEYYGLHLNGYEADGVRPVTVRENTLDWFPSVHLAWHFNDRHLVKISAGRSVNRPEFREIVPYVYYDFSLNANISGMPGLKNAYVGNLDIRYEFYPSPSETLTLGAFHKNFANPIEQTYNEAGSGLQYTYHNAEHATAYGLEAELKKDLTLGNLSVLSLVCNAAYIHSRVYFAQGSFERNRPMQGQSPYLINAGLFYRYEAKGIAASALYNRIGRRIESVGVPMQNPNDDIPDIYEMPRHAIDLTFSKKIGAHLEVKAGIKDLLNAKIAYKQFLLLTDPDSGQSREVEQLIRSYRPGMTLNATVSLKF